MSKIYGRKQVSKTLLPTDRVTQETESLEKSGCGYSRKVERLFTENSGDIKVYVDNWH